MVYEKANSVLTATVDAPNWIHKYIIGRKGANIRGITQDLTKVFQLLKSYVYNK
jgi:ribosomal protein S3